jgi:hypothetical protein
LCQAGQKQPKTSIIGNAGAGVAELADTQDLGCAESTMFMHVFKRFTLGCVRQNWVVFDGFGESLVRVSQKEFSELACYHLRDSRSNSYQQQHQENYAQLKQNSNRPLAFHVPHWLRASFSVESGAWILRGQSQNAISRTWDILDDFKLGWPWERAASPDSGNGIP